ncbi:hypothetical protein DY052_07590 [Apilactobacillus timberlakei]|uniref:hypothetical protein n=1 Tax=Apilactobacillus timberlakei TaxID=2008380 RepID=UPI00112BE7DA|nr:hypothetical protein [Apilactobacillus timberlakei]TPR13716.1 hypothetical protein DY052_07590 [Apilactobacillus timberlakei]
MGAYKRFKNRTKKEFKKTMTEQRAKGHKYAEQRIDAINNHTDNVENFDKQVKQSFEDMKALPTKKVISIVLIILIVIVFTVIGCLV